MNRDLAISLAFACAVWIALIVWAVVRASKEEKKQRGAFWPTIGGIVLFLLVVLAVRAVAVFMRTVN